MLTDQSPQDTPLETQIDQLLTEARVIIPGVQAMLGFQLMIPLTRAFAQLPIEAKAAHAVALCCMALAIILLMAPASLHRIAFAGEDDPEFFRIASLFVILAPLPWRSALRSILMLQQAAPCRRQQPLRSRSLPSSCYSDCGTLILFGGACGGASPHENFWTSPAHRGGLCRPRPFSSAHGETRWSNFKKSASFSELAILLTPIQRCNTAKARQLALDMSG